MTPPAAPRRAQARVDALRSQLRAAERERDRAFAQRYEQLREDAPSAHGLHVILAREAGLRVSQRFMVAKAVARGARTPWGTGR